MIVIDSDSVVVVVFDSVVVVVFVIVDVKVVLDSLHNKADNQADHINPHV